METAALLALALKLLENAPTLIALGTKGLELFMDSKAKMKALAAQKNVTKAQIDALDDSIQARHAQIQAIT